MKKKTSLLLLVFLLIAGLMVACQKPVEKEVGELDQETDEKVEKVKVDLSQGGPTKVTTSANGYGGQTLLASTFEDGKLIDLELLETQDSYEVASRAFEIFKKEALESNSYDIDNITGATYTSNALRTSLEKAYKEVNLTAGERDDKKPVVEDDRTQLLIVGAGPAGLAAGISAAQEGLEDIIIIEKLGILSGNGKFDLNFFDIINSQAQIKNGVEDSKEKFIEDQSNRGETPDRLEVWAEEAEILDKWLREMGVELDYNYGGRNHRHSIDEYAGEEIQSHMEEKIKELGIDIRFESKGGDLIVEDGQVKGLEVEHKGENYKIYADKIIIATGGFSENKELLAKYAPGYEVFNSSNQMSNTGDYVSILEGHDVYFHNMEIVNVLPAILKPYRDVTNSGPGSIFVDQEGNSFVNQGLRAVELGKEFEEKADNKVWMIVDSEKEAEYANVRKQIKYERYKKADSLEELADLIGLNYDNLKASVEAYNEAAENQEEDKFGFIPKRALNPQGPYYASMIEPAVHMTKGGILTDEKCQVIKTDGSIFENLYAAGEVTWQSGAYGQSVAFGKIAGREAARAIME